MPQLLLFLFFYLLVQPSAVIEGAYEVTVTINSFELLESKCSECYSDIPQPNYKHGLCCNGESENGSCPNTCDVKLTFFHLESLSSWRAGPYTEVLLRNNFTTNEVHKYNETGRVGIFNTNPPYIYTSPGKWNASDTLLPLLVIDRDIGSPMDDLIDQYLIPINIPAQSFFSDSFTRNYSRIELTFHVNCIGEYESGDQICESIEGGCDEDCNGGECIKLIDGNSTCVCLNGIIAPNCNQFVCHDDTICYNGGCTLQGSDYPCDCFPGFTGMHCEETVVMDGCESSDGTPCGDKDITTALTADGGVTTIDGGEAIAPASTDGEGTDTGSSLPLTVIVGGAVGGVVCVLVLAIVIVLAVLIFTRIRKSKAYGMKGAGVYDDAFSSGPVVAQNSHLPIYKEADVERKHHKSDIGESDTLKQFSNPVYGDDNKAELELEHEYETADEARSKTLHKDDTKEDQYSELERKFENPIYGDDGEGEVREKDPEYSKLERNTVNRDNVDIRGDVGDACEYENPISSKMNYKSSDMHDYEADEYSKLERKFEKPTYGDDSKDAVHEKDPEYSKLERKFEKPTSSDDSKSDVFKQEQYSKLERKSETSFQSSAMQNDNNCDGNSSDVHEANEYSKLERKFENPIYGDDSEGGAHKPEQYSTLERKFENPIYGEDKNGEGETTDGAALAPKLVNYDQVGNIYHTLESEREREERYARTSLSMSVPEKNDETEWSGGPAAVHQPRHSYEDVH